MSVSVEYPPVLDGLVAQSQGCRILDARNYAQALRQVQSDEGLYALLQRDTTSSEKARILEFLPEDADVNAADTVLYALHVPDMEKYITFCHKKHTFLAVTPLTALAFAGNSN